MNKSIEDIVGKIERDKKIRGTRPGEAERVLYVELRHQNPSAAFDRVVSQAKPLRATHGGVFLDGCFITLPDGTRFCTLMYNLDLDGWRRQIEDGAKELGWMTARIDDGRFV